MFSGIVAAMGRVVDRLPLEGGAELVVAAPGFADGLAIGESVAVSGTCLTVTAVRGERFAVQAIRETLDRTTLGGAAPGGRVNLERALRASDRLGGHFVTGHVDATARVIEVAPNGAEWRLRVETPDGLAGQIAEKGSIALDGVSLTVGGVGAGDFTVFLIPFTRDNTTLGEIESGRAVNLETDLLAKHVARLVALGGLDAGAARDAPRGGALR
jgi:riboflavin synthase